MNRRDFVALGALAIGTSLSPWKAEDQQSAHTGREYSGPNLAGWNYEVGDAVRPGMGQVTSADIALVHSPQYSEVQSNILGRVDIMAHNLAYTKVTDEACLGMVHSCEYQIRLAVLPNKANPTHNGQTVEGSITLWDGKTTRRQMIVGWQWILNPHWVEEFGTIQCWMPDKTWRKVGSLPPDDTDWHTIRLVIDPVRGTTSFQFDSNYLPGCFARHDAPAWFGDDVSAWVAVEAISIDPGDNLQGGKRHTIQARNWHWVWEPASFTSVYLPQVTR